MINWTKYQKEAIKIKDKNLLVSAAAGSGKTAVLVERVVDTIIEKKVDIDEFLVVTFTNKAAKEMKKKIQKNLIGKLDKEGIDKFKIKRQLDKLDRSYISTIHSFCLNILRKYYYKIDIDPNFTITSLEEREILLTDSLDEVLEESYLENTKEFQNLVDNYSEDRGDSKLVKLISQTYNEIQSYAYPIRWLEESIEMLNIKSENNLWMDIIIKEANKLLEDAKIQIDKLEKIFNHSGSVSKYIETLRSDKEIVIKLDNLIKNDFKEFKNYLHSFTYQRLATVPKKEKDEYCEEFKIGRDHLKNIINQVINIVPDKSMEELLEDTKMTYEPMRGLLIIIKKLDKRFKEMKNERSLCDFNDLEHYALSLLELEEVANYYRNKFKYIYIDEYQDSNQVQETIIEKIKRKDNLFMVGDVKQSIYRFRQADPTIFTDKYNKFSLDGNTKDKIVNLNKNFRSKEEILSCINYLFKNIMSLDLGEVDYISDNYLYKGMDFEEKQEETPVELNIFDKYAEEKEDIDDELMELQNTEIEAEIAVNKIKEILGKEIYTRDEGFKNIEYKDIVILLRATKNSQDIYEDVFNKKNLPLYIDSNEGYFDSIEIKIVINLLKLIDNFKQDIPLISVMKSPIGEFSVEELIQIRLKYKDTPYYQSFLDYEREEEDNISDKLKKFLNKIKKWRELNNYKNLNVLIWDIIIETEYYYFVGMLPKGRIRQGNLKLLVDKAYNYEKTKMKGLVKFLEFIEKVKTSSKDMGNARILGENDNVIRLMSIHKSKGLEFPVVIIGGLNKKFNLTKNYKDVIIHNKLRLAPKYLNLEENIFKETLPTLSSKLVLKKEDLSEEMRVLYVGMTRAINKLILIGTVKNLEKKKEKWKLGLDYFNLLTASSFLDWIGKSLYIHEDGVNIRKEDEKGEEDLEFNSKWKINLLDYEYLNGNKENFSNREKVYKDILKLEKNEDINIDNVDKILGWKYPYYEDKEIPTKITVTQLSNLKRTQYKEIKYKIPKINEIPNFKKDVTTFTAQERGTITHLVMQIINLNKNMNQEYIKEEIAKMVINKQISEEESKVVDIESLINFYASNIGKRMLKSRRIMREAPFIIKKSPGEIKEEFKNYKEKVLVQGIIDCYFYEDEDIVLIDYKTDSLYNIKTDHVINQYKLQIQEYKRALELLTKKHVKESYIYLLSVNKFIKVM